MEYTKHNILKNSLKNRIRPFETSPSDLLIPLDDFGLQKYTFSTTKPTTYLTSTLTASISQ